VVKCLAKIPAERYQSMDEVLEAMRRVASSVGVSGVFSGPRLQGTGSGPISGPYGTTGSGPSTMALDISVEEEAAAKPDRRPLAVGLFAGSLLLGVGVAAFLALRPATPQPLPIQPLAEVPPSQAPVAPRPAAAAAAAQPGADDEELALAELAPAVKPVRFLIASEPSGARVKYRGKDLGETPLNLDVTPGSDGIAEATLSFNLDGYAPASYTLKSAGPEERHTQKLQKKKASTKSGKASGSSPYKDDPYQ
jgi:serine/threonine-protein kinase